MHKPIRTNPYVLRRKNIHPQVRLPVPELISEQMVALGWPVELQGSGITNYKTGDLKIYYPVGDLFLSAVIAIHEVGHWRQCEIDRNLERRERFIPEEDMTDYVAVEEEAYDRGWRRIRGYAPEMIEWLDAQLGVCHQRGQLEHFNSFEQFYRTVESLCQIISRIMASVDGDKRDDGYYARALAALKDGGAEKVFSDLTALRGGENLSAGSMEAYLLLVAQGVADE